MKWTKKQIRELQGHLDTAWLLFRPLSNYRGLMSEAEEEFSRILPERRIDLVMSGVRGAGHRAAERYCTDCEAIGNAIVRRIYGDKTDEFVARFRADAIAEDEARIKQEEVLRRLHSEPLPPEVANYDPISKKVLARPEPMAKVSGAGGEEPNA